MTTISPMLLPAEKDIKSQLIGCGIQVLPRVEDARHFADPRSFEDRVICAIRCLRHQRPALRVEMRLG